MTICAATTDPAILEQAYDLDDADCCLFCGPTADHDNPLCPDYDDTYDLDDNDPTVADCPDCGEPIRYSHYERTISGHAKGNDVDIAIYRCPCGAAYSD